MNTKHVESKFAEIGARLKVLEIPARQPIVFRRLSRPVSRTDYAVDIRSDERGQFFQLRVPDSIRHAIEVTVMQAEPKKRHLLLLVRKTADKPQLDRFLCGHDEREWFVAAVPGGASSVRQAMDALQPPEVRNALARSHVSSTKRYARKNRAFRRQGEWFFVPEPGLAVSEKLVLRNEPLRRGSGKPHMVEQLYRTGGETVYVCMNHPNGITAGDYRELLRASPKAAQWSWRVMSRNPGVYVRGTVRHSDHATITLPNWHRVVMNTESQSRTMANVAFLD
jgi:hypothetical protein